MNQAAMKSWVIGVLAICATAVIAEDLTALDQLTSARAAGLESERVLRYERAMLPPQTGASAIDPSDSLQKAKAPSNRTAPAPTEFQKYVLEATGKLLPLFGASFFAGETAPARNNPVTASRDYVLGPDDEVQIRSAGALELDTRTLVDRNGQLTIPRIGSVAVAGKRMDEVEALVRNAADRQYRGVNLSLSLGRLRGMRIYAVGQAANPGAHTVSGMTTLIAALAQIGGPSPIGSMRNIQVKRAGKTIAELDFYAFFANGDNRGDIPLADGDAIVFPPAHGFAAVYGTVEKSAIIELKDQQTTLKSTLELLGGLPVMADPRRIYLERFDPSVTKPRTVEALALDANGLARSLRNGDIVNVMSVIPEFSNVVTLRGNVNQALRVPFRGGMKVADLIPSREFLVSKQAIRRLNRSLIAQDERDVALQKQLFPQETATLERNGRQGVLPLDLKNVEREPKYEISDPVANIGGSYGGVNWDQAVIERLDRASMSTRIISFNLRNALNNPTSQDNYLLEAGDVVNIFAAGDFQGPSQQGKVLVRLEGEVKLPGLYETEPGESLVNLIYRAGGLTADAYLFGAEFTRESVRRSRQQNLEQLTTRLERQGFDESARLLANISSNDANGAQLAQSRVALEKEARARFIARLRELRPTGRIALGFDSVNPALATLPTIRPENGDRIVIPPRPAFVQVLGAVNAETAMLWQKGLTVHDYLQRAGISSDADKSETFVIRADGTVVAKTSSLNIFSSILGVEAYPGDVIVTPEKKDREGGWNAFARVAKDWTQIFSNLGLGAAAIKTLRQ